VAGQRAVPRLASHALHSQIAMHQAYGGVVPELASRDHIRRVLPLTQTVFDEAGKRLADVDVVAYTRGPGLAGALLVGPAWPARWARRWASRCWVCTTSKGTCCRPS
jgi:N6-L-threonylcarbamoyladenine synthase